MHPKKIENVNIVSHRALPSPKEVKLAVPLEESAKSTIFTARETVEKILSRADPRLLLVVGPCSIHDLKAATEYAERLKALADEVNDSLFIIMRVYFEKPRTSIGWKGFINDPHLNDSFSIDEGMHLAREFMVQLAELGLPVGTEALDPITPQYLSDLITWNAIGARTTESQTHRELASGLSTPIGFKNGTDGNIEVAVNALLSSSQPHHFLGIDSDGKCAVFETKGNQYGHIVLRGGKAPNYGREDLTLCEAKLIQAGLPPNIMIDCSHANSLKDPALQPYVFKKCLSHIVNGVDSIMGLMLESNLAAGNQALRGDPETLRYGVSITDGCIDWETTEMLIRDAREIINSNPRLRGAKCRQDQLQEPG